MAAADSSITTNTVNSTHRVPRYQREAPVAQPDDLQAVYEREWEELARHDQGSLNVILISKIEDNQNEDQSSNMRQKQPSRQSSEGSSDTLYKILVYKT